jgi:sialate O-acetylesterase
MRRALVLSVFGLLVVSARAELRLAGIFQDHAVLQRGSPVPVWGEADAGATVTISHRGHTAVATANARGRWRADLPVMAASAVGADLVVTTAREQVVRHDLLIGEVWLCSGQSNMEWTVVRSQNADAEIASAHHPEIRHFKVGLVSALEPVETVCGHWRVCSPEHAGGFTAVGYYFARALAERLQVPVGVINSSWGGTPIEAWMSTRALLSDPAFAVVFERRGEEIGTFPARKRRYAEAQAQWAERKGAADKTHLAFAEAAPRDPTVADDRHQPGGLYAGMVAPLAPYALRGIVWYQGENNASHASEYEALLLAWARDWRRLWPEAPIVIVQLPNYESGDARGTSWARLREAQAKMAWTVPQVALVVTIDLGDPHNVHPINKRPVGERVALAARAAVYGETVVSQGPVVRDIGFEADAARVFFDHAEGLRTDGDRVLGFEIAGSDRRFVPAEAVIEGTSVRVIAPTGLRPVAVRHAWCNAPSVTLRNAAGLPAAPFRSDHWNP